MNNEEIVYFEIDNWFAGRDYPACEPFISWMANETYKSPLRDEEFVKKNKICVKWYPVDMSFDFLITAPMSFVKEVCPDLLKEENKKFIRTPRTPDDVPNAHLGNKSFLPYTEPYIGTIVEGDEWY